MFEFFCKFLFLLKFDINDNFLFRMVCYDYLVGMRVINDVVSDDSGVRGVVFLENLYR